MCSTAATSTAIPPPAPALRCRGCLNSPELQAALPEGCLAHNAALISDLPPAIAACSLQHPSAHDSTMVDQLCVAVGHLEAAGPSVCTWDPQHWQQCSFVLDERETATAAQSPRNLPRGCGCCGCCCKFLQKDSKV